MTLVRRTGQSIDRVMSGMQRLFILAGCVLLWGIVALIIVQMFSRVVLRVGLPWPEELARYFHIVLIFIGVAFAHRFREHIDMHYLTTNLSPSHRRAVFILTELAIIAASGVIVAGGVLLIIRMGHQRSPSLGLPLLYFVLPTIVGFSFLILESARQVILRWSTSERRPSTGVSQS